MIERFFLAAGSWLVFVRRPNGLNNRFLIFSLSLSLSLLLLQIYLVLLDISFLSLFSRSCTPILCTVLVLSDLTSPWIDEFKGEWGNSGSRTGFV